MSSIGAASSTDEIADVIKPALMKVKQLQIQDNKESEEKDQHKSQLPGIKTAYQKRSLSVVDQ